MEVCCTSRNSGWAWLYVRNWLYISRISIEVGWKRKQVPSLELCLIVTSSPKCCLLTTCLIFAEPLLGILFPIIPKSNIFSVLSNALAAKKANSTFDCIRQSVASRSREASIPSCSELVRQRPDWCIYLWALLYSRNVDVVEWVQELQRWWKDWNSTPMRNGWESWGCSTWRGEALGRSHQTPPSAQN